MLLRDGCWRPKMGSRDSRSRRSLLMVMASEEESAGPDEICIGPVGPIAVREIDAVAAAQRRADAAVADALHTPTDLQAGMYHDRPQVRMRVIDRLIARGSEHPRTVATFIDVLQHDPDADVRYLVAGRMYAFADSDEMIAQLFRTMSEDADPEVKAEALFSLDQLGLLDS